MRPDKLESLLDTFIRNRTEYDVVDGPMCALNRQVVHGHIQALNLQAESGPSDGSEPGGLIFDGTFFAGGYVSPQVSPTIVNSNRLVAVGRQLVDLAANFSASRPECSHFRFEKSCIIVSPEEQILTISVVRLDNFRNKVCHVKWKTCDKTAFSGTHYVGSSGEFVFAEGEDKKTFQIKLLSSSSDSEDLRFAVQMSIVDDGFDPKPMTVSLKDLKDFYPDERKVVENLQTLSLISVEDVRSYLEDSLTSRTFHMALTHLCSTADSVPLEFALAFDLSRLCFSKLPSASVLKVLQDFFRKEDIDC